MILNEKVFAKSVILNKFFFVLSHFELNFFRLVRFWIKFFTRRQILKQIFEHASDFGSNNLKRVRFCVYFFAVWQMFLRST